MPKPGPQRIVCLTEETTEWLYLLGEEDRIVGISAYTCRPARAREEKPVVSAFIGGSVKKIKALQPDLIIGFSDVQADLARDLIRENLPVLITNQRSIEDILDTLAMVGRMVGAEERALELISGFRQRIDQLRAAKVPGSARPRVYFEEWPDPMISAIQWVSELIEVAGGENIFADRAAGPAARDRYVSIEEIVDRQPDIFIGCWCGKPLERAQVLERPGFQDLPAVKNDHIYEIDPAIILQPGPACLTAGLDALYSLINSAQA